MFSTDRTLLPCCRNYRRYNRFFHRGLLEFCILQYVESLLETLFFVFAYLVEQADNPSKRCSELAPRDILWLTVLTHFPISTDIKEPDFKHIHCKVAGAGSLATSSHPVEPAVFNAISKAR